MGSEIFETKVDADIVTTDEFIDFINSFERPLICQVCGNQQWTVSVTTEIKVKDDEPEHTVVETIGYAQFNKKEDSAINYPGGLPVIRMTCGCCGNLLLFSYKAVRKLISSKAEGTKSE
ncbi:TPA: hypothetical protein LU102_004362 [Enterobacter hormaechei subsp. xiangfangensis]|nr:hypothetical protein [Enterobacter hormaechei subsp. xiangfangensis]